MSNISFDLSGKIDRNTIAALSAVKSAADSLNIRFFVIGATARDLILRYCYGIEPPRMTRDVDIGVEVAGWEEFQRLTKALTETGEFISAKESHRFLFGFLRIDIVPFGSISDKNMRISWPPEHEIFMSLAGFDEAYKYSITVKLSSNPDLFIKLPTLAGLAIMKLISWKDTYPERRKDAEDLFFIMRKYEEAGNTERLYTEEQGLLEEEGFDTNSAGARLLGHDMASIANPDTLSAIINILRSETGEHSRYSLIYDMIRGVVGFSDDFEKTLHLVEKLKQGIEENRRL